MSWQAVTFAGLGLVLVGGFWWYERTRPSARLVALVAALAALAIAGRLVLAPIPNVVATTDIALITGYALGAGPGFAVGALAAPISNIWLGQGPWTAWEMAGWGLVGLGGAWLGILTQRRLGRLGLATFCAVAGFAYGALLDLSVMVTYGGEQSLDRYLALSARGLPFNIAHAAGNFVIALAAGPALVRMILRFRTRMQFTWRQAGALPLLSLVLVALASAIAVAGGSAPPAEAKRSSVSWLEATQNDDGGFAATAGQASSPAMTGWVMLGLEAAGRNPRDTRTEGEDPVGYLRDQAGRLRSVGDLERTILALTAAGLNPRRFAGHDLVAELRSRLDRDGSVDGQVNLTAFYLLAMRAAGDRSSTLKRPAKWLRRAQNSDGGWGIQPEAPSESDSTGAVLQGLIAAGARGSATGRGSSWLIKAQRTGGGYALGGSGVVNSQSTAWAVQGLVAAGSGGDAVNRAIGYLGRLRASDGHYRYSASSDQTPVWVTAQVLMAIERQPFPVPAVARTTSTGSRADGGRDGGAEADQGSSATPDSSSEGTGQTSPDSASGGAARAGGGSSGGAGSDPGSDPGSNVGTGDEPVASSGSDTDATGNQTPAEAPGSEPATTLEPGEQAPISVSYADTEPDSGDSSTTYILIGLAVLAVIGVGGYAYHRRSAA